MHMRSILTLFYNAQHIVYTPFVYEVNVFLLGAKNSLEQAH